MITKYSIGKKFSLSFLLLSSLLFGEQTYTVDDLILKALDLSPDLEISSSQYEASRSRYDEAFSAYLPTVNLHGAAGVVGASDVPIKPDEIKSDTVILGQLSLKQIIYDFGKTGGLSNSTEYESDSFLSNHSQLLSNKKKDVKSAYYDVLKKKSLIQVNIENVKLNEAQLYRSQKYFEAGIRTKIDVTDAQVELIKSKLDLNNANYNLKLAYAKLDKTIGYMQATRDYRVFYKELDIKNIALDLQAYSFTLSDSIAFAYENRYQIKKYEQLIESSKAKEEFTSSEYFPQLYLNADYIKQNVGDELKQTTPQDQWSAMVNFDWNIYEGGSSSARNEEQRIQTNISHAQLEFTKLEIKTEVTNAYINLDRVKDSVLLSQSLLNASKEKFDQAGKRYEHGLSDYIELQQARQGYIDASSSLVIDYYNYFEAIAILDNAIGK